jgi:hypothetical protein
MSWSVQGTGKVAEVKAALADAFARAKKQTESHPHESKSVGLVEQIVNDQLDFLAELTPPPEVNVSASGSVWKPASGTGGSSQIKLDVSPKQ